MKTFLLHSFHLKTRVLVILTFLLSVPSVHCVTPIKPPPFTPPKPPLEIPRVRAAYITADYTVTVNPTLFTHYFYAFAKFDESLTQLVITNPENLKKLVNLKQDNPELKVILSIGGGAKRGEPLLKGFSECSSTPTGRLRFALQCKNFMTQYGLDGIDLDWEFPGTSDGGWTSSPNDKENYTLLVKQLRTTLGQSAWISVYSFNDPRYIDFPNMMPYITYVNMSGYDMYPTPKTPNDRLYHNSALYPSKTHGERCVDASVRAHKKAGVPIYRMLLGIPFYGKIHNISGKESCSRFYKDLLPLFSEGNPSWDYDAQVPFYKELNTENSTDTPRRMIITYDDRYSIRLKVNYALTNNMAGVFVWAYDGDDYTHSLSHGLNDAWDACIKSLEETPALPPIIP